MGTTAPAPPRLAERPTNALSRWATTPLGPLLLFAVLRLPILLSARAPVIVPDETGSWAIGRWLSGMRPLIEMNDMPDYSLLPGMVLVPLQWLPVDSSTRYRLGLLVGSALVVAAAFLLRSAVRVVTGDRVLAAAAFAITLLFPATFLTSVFTWAEASVLLCVAAFVRGLVACLFTGGPTATGPVLVTGFVAGAAPFVHGRLLVLPVVWLALMVWAAARRSQETPLNEAPRSRLLAGAAFSVVTALALGVLDHIVKQAVWTDARAAEDAVLSGLFDPSSWPDVIRAGTGQLWYAAVASLGLGVLGAMAALRLLWRTSSGAVRTLCAVMVVCGVGVAVTSAAFMSETVGNVGVDQQGRMGGIRWDHLAYGRYLDVMLLLATIAGACALHRWPVNRSRLALGGAAAAAVVPALLLNSWWAGAQLAGSIRPTTAGVTILADLTQGLPVLGATGIAVAAMVAFALVVGLRRGLLMPLLGSLLCVGAFVAAGVAVDMHGPRDVRRVFEDLPVPAGSASEVVVPADLNEGLPYVLVWHRMQVMAVPEGWHFDFESADSSTVAKSPGGDAGLVVLPNEVGAPGGAGGWEPQWANEDVTLWWRPG